MDKLKETWMELGIDTQVILLEESKIAAQDMYDQWIIYVEYAEEYKFNASGLEEEQIQTWTNIKERRTFFFAQHQIQTFSHQALSKIVLDHKDNYSKKDYKKITEFVW